MLSRLKLIIITVSLIFSNQIYAAPKSDLWSFWNKSNPNNTQKIDHSAWQKILDKNLIIQGQNTLFKYKTISVQDKNNLQRYIQKLTSIDPRNYNKNEQFAYWVNIYNALTVNLILKNYPVASITKLGTLFSFGPWDEKITKISGKDLTLNDIEHRILRPIWKDSRIHYVVNCASLGCPNLSPTAFTSANNERQLNRAATDFVNSPKGVSIKGNTLTLSSIYDWYSVDFGKNEQQVLKSIDKYRQGQKLQGWKGKIEYKYDWKLNQASTK